MTDAATSHRADNEPIPITGVRADDLDALLQRLDEPARRFAAVQGFKADAGTHVLLPDSAGNIAHVLFGLGGQGGRPSPLLLGKLASALPNGDYRLAGGFGEPELAALAFMLGSYRFDRYRKPKENGARLVPPDGADAGNLQRIRDGVFLARDLINMPANDLSPHDLAGAAGALAGRFGASVSVIDGEALTRDFPMLHAVGAGSDRPPCLISSRFSSALTKNMRLTHVFAQSASGLR